VQAPVAAVLPDLSAVASRAIPSVMNIASQQVVRGQPSPFTSDPLFRYFFGDREMAPRSRVAQSLGSGVIVSSDGFILTNNHVVGDANAQVSVVMPDKRELKAKIVGVDEWTDIALLKIDARGLPVIPWGDSSKLKVAEWVLAIGNSVSVEPDRHSRHRQRPSVPGPFAPHCEQPFPDCGSILPAPHTDFIYAVIVSELGLFGGAGLILVYALIAARGFKTAVMAPDGFSKLLAAGLTAVFALQAFVIVGGVVKLIPLTGVTLPFVSYGGSSVVANMILVALLLLISDRARRPPPRRQSGDDDDLRDVVVG